MKISCLLPLLIIIFSTASSAQELSKSVRIAETRKNLLTAFNEDDHASVGLWMDSLIRMEDETYLAMAWDERWLLYYWNDSYGNMLEEVANYDENKWQLQSYKVQAPNDRLFPTLDSTVYENRFLYFHNIKNAFLSEEEKAFATLQLEYLLRMNKDEENWNARLDAFESKFPSSRMLPFISYIKPHILKPSHHAIGFAGGLGRGTWTDRLDRNVKSFFALDMEAYYWYNRWSGNLRFNIGGNALARDVYIGTNIWPKNDPTTIWTLGAELGYDIIDRPEARIFGSIGPYVTSFAPTTPDENEDPYPDFYDDFYLLEGHWAASINADIKLFKKNYKAWSTPKGSYHGFRLRLSYHRMRLGKEIPGLRGNMLFFAVNYNIFAFRTSKK